MLSINHCFRNKSNFDCTNVMFKYIFNTPLFKKKHNMKSLKNNKIRSILWNAITTTKYKILHFFFFFTLTEIKKYTFSLCPSMLKFLSKQVSFVEIQVISIYTPRAFITYQKLLHNELFHIYLYHKTIAFVFSLTSYR